MKWADIKEMITKPSKSVCTSAVVVYPKNLSPTPSTSAAIKTPGNTEADPDDPEPTTVGDNQMEYTSD